MKTPGKLLFSGAWLTLIVISSCSKIPFNPPIPNPGLESLEQFPFQRYIDSVLPLAKDSIYLLVQPVGLFDQLVQHAEVPGQCESDLAFRSSVGGAVTSLGVLEPATGYIHTVTLWDSSSGMVLAQTDVPSLDSGRWTYVSLALTAKEVPIQANHGYIIGFNTLAQGSALDVNSPGNEVMLLYGIQDFRSIQPGGVGGSPIFPFTKAGITYESQTLVYYDHVITGPLFPGSPGSTGVDTHTVLGVCDIGFIAAPQ